MPDNHTRSVASESEQLINDLMRKGDKIGAAREFLRDDNSTFMRTRKKQSPLYNKAIAKARETLKSCHKNYMTYDEDDVVQECFWYCMGHYDSEKSDNFVAYFMTYIGYKAMDMADNKHIKVEHDENTLPARTGRPDELTEGKSAAAARVLKLLTPVTRFAETGFQKKVYPYFKCFATEYVMRICKHGLHHIIEINENDTFCAMDTAFLDYTLTEICRALTEIEMTPLKTYKEMGFSKKDEELKIPLEQIVFTTYLGVSNGAVSQNRKKFDEQAGIDREAGIWN